MAQATVKRVKPVKSVKSILAKKVEVKTAKKSAVVARNELLHAMSLPTEKKKPILDMQEYSLLIFGRPKVGKTTFFSSFPDVLFLTTEPGTKGRNIFEFNAEGGGVVDWHVMLRAVELLEKERDRFKCVVIDTAEKAYEMCLDHTCEVLHLEYPGVNSDGSEEASSARSWIAVRKAFCKVVQRILQTGRAVHWTSHAKEVTVKERSGNKFTQIVPTLTGQARGVIEPLVDWIFFADYMNAGGGKSARVLVTEGTELIATGSRSMGDLEFPPLLPMVRKDGYGMLMAALAGEDVGLDLSKLLPSNKAFKTMREYTMQAKARGSKVSRVVKHAKGG